MKAIKIQNEVNEIKAYNNSIENSIASSKSQSSRDNLMKLKNSNDNRLRVLTNRLEKLTN